MSNINSPAPGTPQTGTKATGAAIIGFIGAFLAAFVNDWSGSQDVDVHTIVVAILAALATAAAGGVATYNITNKPK
jgi:hypothetical protein